ncbi:MAG: hypothetical protein P1U58_10600 [Verrucomicrobiales bacterium]|nr:hypothetical protein [Verrucomicrobiales bacterium]
MSLISASAQLFGEEDLNIYLAATETGALIAKEGQKVIVYGETIDSTKSSSGANFVKFEGADFFLVTFKSDLEQFPDGEPFELFDGKRIAVEGAISIYQDNPQIKLTRPDQITVLEPGAVFPPVVEKPKEVAVEKASPKTMEEPQEAPVEEEPKRKPPVDASEFFD